MSLVSPELFFPLQIYTRPRLTDTNIVSQSGLEERKLEKTKSSIASRILKEVLAL